MISENYRTESYCSDNYWMTDAICCVEIYANINNPATLIHWIHHHHFAS